MPEKVREECGRCNPGLETSHSEVSGPEKARKVRESRVAPEKAWSAGTESGWGYRSVPDSHYVVVMALMVVAGPSSPGPGEREQMLEIGASHLNGQGVGRDQVVRIDVPGRGGGESGDGALRVELEPMIPLLQSGSLFGEPQGLELVDAQNLQKPELETLIELIEGADLSKIEVILVYGGAVPKAIKDLNGQMISVKKMWERQAAQWLEGEITRRELEIDKRASEALMKRFGTDTASMGQALDQLEETSGRITADLIMDRFKNRPDEPTWNITDAIARGDVSTALRRLSDFLVHGHPLVYLASLESDLKKRALAATAPDKETLKEWIGGSDRQIGRLWSQRGKVRESALRSAQQALVRADRVIKTHPEEVHRVTLERLTVAFCRWYG
jgi:DNA polymerase III delta subunit